jgi:hypothetical protein
MKSNKVNMKQPTPDRDPELTELVTAIANQHNLAKQKRINAILSSKTILQVINDFMVEVDAKNSAYYFILENGYFEAFKEYCKKKSYL